MEAFMEAHDMKQSILGSKDLWNKYGSEGAKEIAADEARNTFGLNMLALAASNAFEVGTLYNAFKKTKAASRGLTDVILDKAGSAVEAPKNLLSKVISNPYLRVGAELGGNMAAEGLYEENIQYLIQALGENRAHYGYDSGTFWESLSDLKKAVPTMFSN